ncbi:MAG: PAS domain S-box protein [Ignavibacteriae bacterium]|nr:PAS domain S-box protein [Ignavibacteriota bacterium]
MIYLISSLLLPVELCLSQTEYFDEDWRWTHFTTESGLPSNNVNQIYEARDGMMWAATAKGIVWFDGFEWQSVKYSYQHDVTVTGTIRGEMNDSILLGPADGFLYLGKKTFRKFAIGKVDGVALLNDSVILALKNEQLWKIKNESMSLYTNQSKLFPDRIFLMYPVRAGTVLLDAKPGLYMLKGGSLTILFRSDTKRIRFNSVQENENGNGIVSVELPDSSKGIWLWDSVGNFTREKTEGKDVVIAVAIGAHDERIAVYKTGVVRSSISGNWKTVYENTELRKTLTICISKNGDIWFATTNGVYVYRRSLLRWQYWKHPPPDFRNACNEILKTRDGNFWIATGNGIDIREKDGRVRTIESINGKRLFVVTGLAEDSSGNIWISSGASFTGTYRWDGKDWKHFDPWFPSYNAWIHKIYVDPQRRIWFLGLGKYTPRHGDKQPGVFMYEEGRFTHLGEEDGLLSGRVYSFAYSSDSSLWFGTYKGISRLKNGVWKHWRSGELNSGRAFTIAVDYNDRLWFGEHDSRATGLGCIETDGSIQHYTTNEGLINNNIWDIRADAHGKIWVSTPNGINCFDNGTFISYDERSGLKSSGGNWPILPLEDNVYVGTTGEGVAILKRDEEMTPPPRIILESPIVEEYSALVRWKALSFWGELLPEDVPTRFKVNGGNWSAWSKIHEVELKELEPGNYYIQVQAKGLLGTVNTKGQQATFTIAPPLYLRPVFYYPVGGSLVTIIGLLLMLQRSRIRRRREIAVSEAKFRAVATTTASAILVFQDERLLFANHSSETMTGFTQTELMNKSFWDLIHPEALGEIKEFMQDWLTKTSVPRRFECKILTKKNATKWLDVTAARISFMNTMAVIVSAFDITERKHYEERLRAVARELTRTEERERKRIATFLHDSLGHTLASGNMKIDSLLNSGTPEVSSSSLLEIQKSILEAIQKTRTLTYEVSLPILFDLGLVPAIEWLAEQMQIEHSLTVTVNVVERKILLDPEIRNILFDGIREAMVNIAKHANATVVTVEITKQNNSLYIKVHDNGIGFDSTHIGQLQQSKKSFGLFNVRNRLSDVGGTMEIQSSPGLGTSVIFQAPVKR